MDNLFEKIKHWTRGLLLKIAKDLKTDIPKFKSVGRSKNLFSKEIKIPIYVSLIFTIIAIYGMLVIGIGISCRSLIATAILIVLSVVFFIVQIQNKEKTIIKDNDAIVLMCLLFIIAMLIFQILKEFLSPFLSPVAAFSLMAAMLLSTRIGILYAVCLSLFVTFLNDMKFEVFLMMLCSGIVVVTNVQDIRKRSDFVNIGVKTAFANVVIMTMFYFFGSYSIFQFKHNLLHGVLNGAITIVILLVCIPLFEKIFSRMTNIKLIELSDFNNPLLRRLMLEAPGTYHHSIMTADIAEQAANIVNENSLLARVGSYYHDIGKLKNPKYFIENQMTGRNLHDDLNPIISSLILTAHVKDGTVLAKKYNMDNEIINIIEQHHGTTPIHIFYHRALEISSNVNIEDFRYPGPKPTTRVSAIVMVADSCEAACRTIYEPTSVRIRNTVERIINNKFVDEQFSECSITLKDLKLIRDSIISTIMGIYHARILYK
ncbi:MAG: HDIG domain-containing protein [Endomicrobium sp.]|jgi:putative nucleotidyltransferase with HDIG domain|nr:HDIG domain-containing protein [Endomicrobium sp.]